MTLSVTLLFVQFPIYVVYSGTIKFDICILTNMNASTVLATGCLVDVPESRHWDPQKKKSLMCERWCQRRTDPISCHISQLALFLHS